MKYSFLMLLLLMFCSQQLLFAQNEILRERSTLIGIQEFGIVVNIEKPGSLNDPALNTGRIREQIQENFSDLPVTILDDKVLQQSDQFPILHVHVNVMKSVNETYPFAIELNFYQPVKLVLNRDMQTMASTWNAGQIGIVSEDLLIRIANEAVYAANEFKNEYLLVN